MTDFKPSALEQAVESIVNSMDDENKNRLLEAELSDLLGFHHGWGTGIRNDFNLSLNVELLTDCGSPSMHADDASAVIMNAVWYYLHDQPVSNARIENYRRIEDVIREHGVESLYYRIRCKKSGVRDKDQNIYRMLKMYFAMDFKEYKQLAAELDAKKPIENAE